MTIRQRIALLVVLMFTAIAAIGGYAIVQSRRGAAEVKTVTEGVVPSALASADLVSQLKDVQLAVIVLASSSEPALEQAARDKLDAAQTALQSMLDAQQRGANSAAQKGLVLQARESLDNYFGAIGETLSLKAAGKNELAQANLFGNVVQYEGELQQIVDTLRIEKTRSKDQAIASLNDNLASTASAISILTAVSVLVLSVVGLLLYRRITGPITRMQAAMSEIADKQDFRRRVSVDNMDEIGHSIVAFNGMIEKIETSSEQLRQKTADIEALLSHLPQGVMSVNPDLLVHGEYSACLQEILGTADIAGQPLRQLLLDRIQLDQESLSQMEETCRAVLGEDVLNFGMNAHLLIHEADLAMGDGQTKRIEFSWAPIVDEHDQVLRLMICLRDVTELRRLSLESQRQRRELNMIGQLLELGSGRALTLLEQARASLRDCLVMAGEPVPQLTQIMRQLHTLKGNARTAGLQSLSQAVHEAETLCVQRQGGEGTHDAMLASLQQAQQVVEEYRRIQRERLGHDNQAANDSNSVVLDRPRLVAQLRRLQAAGADQALLAACRSELLSLLPPLTTQSLAEALAPAIADAPRLAEELGKPAPLIHLSRPELRLSLEHARLLADAFGHLLRNALDHGLESAEERQAQNKRQAGQITLEAQADHQSLSLRLRDDGRGLMLWRIRAKAQAAGLIDAQTQLADEDLAALIFAPGFSTAQQVSAISGRGVGLDAVRDLFQGAGGAVRVHLLGEAGGNEARAFELQLSLPLVAEQDLSVAEA